MGLRPPSIDALAASLDDGRLPRALLVKIARDAVAEWRRDETGDPTELARRAVERAVAARSGRVINATGVLLHTNLGRAPLHPEAAAAAAAAGIDYTALELDLETGKRGGRGAVAHELACSLTGAEAALVVSNNAGALLLVIAALAGKREVISSRGEQIEIGGSFRLPEITAAAQASSVEVGTTNRTRISDYEAAITPSTGLMLKVHPSNYRVEGFVEEVSYRDLIELAHRHELQMAADLGSGLLDERVPWVAGAPPGWLAGEPGARQIIDSGADVVLFSGDKLLGGPQAGIIAGSSDTVGALRSHPLARAVRIGGSPLAALTATLSLYAGGRGAEIPFWAMALTSAEDLERRCAALIITSGGEITPGESVLGGGSAPGAAIPGPVVRIACRAEAARLSLLRADPPVIARVDSGHLVVDLRTVGQSDDEYLAEALAKACR